MPIQIKILTVFLNRNSQGNSKFEWECNDPKISKIIFRQKNKAEGPMLPNLKNSYNNKNVGLGIGYVDLTEAEWRILKQTQLYSQVIFNKKSR